MKDAPSDWNTQEWTAEYSDCWMTAQYYWIWLHELMAGHLKTETEIRLEKMSTAEHEALKSEDYIEFLKFSRSVQGLSLTIFKSAQL